MSTAADKDALRSKIQDLRLARKKKKVKARKKPGETRNPDKVQTVKATVEAVPEVPQNKNAFLAQVQTVCRAIQQRFACHCSPWNASGCDGICILAHGGARADEVIQKFPPALWDSFRQDLVAGGLFVENKHIPKFHDYLTREGAGVEDDEKHDKETGNLRVKDVKLVCSILRPMGIQVTDTHLCVDLHHRFHKYQQLGPLWTSMDDKFPMEVVGAKILLSDIPQFLQSMKPPNT